MLMPPSLFHLLQYWARRFPIPHGDPGEAHEEACRQWTTQFIQQAVFQFPYEGYGAKRASPDRPLSKDVIARFGPPLIGWDVLVGAGTGAPTLIDGPTDSLDLSGQVYEPVPPQDALRLFPPNVDPGPLPEEPADPLPPPSLPPEPPLECGMCRECLEVLKAELASANEQRMVVIQILSKLPTLDELRGLIGELRVAPLPVKMRW